MGGKRDGGKPAPEMREGEHSQIPPSPRTRKNRRGLAEVYKIAAARIGSGERASEVARDMGLDEGNLSRLKWGTDPTSTEYQRHLKAANDKAIGLAGAAVLHRMLDILRGGSDRDAAAAARELGNFQKNLASLKTDLEKLAIERERLDVQRLQAQAVADAAAKAPTGLVFVPAKDEG